MKALLLIVVGLSIAHAEPKPRDAHAVYLDAVAAFQSGDFDHAQQLAAHAVVLDGPDRLAAQILYADALYRRNEHGRARDVYAALLAAGKGDRAVLEKKLAAANRALEGAPAGPGAPPPKQHPADPDALYSQAVGAFQADLLDEALELARRSILGHGSHWREAQALYGDILFKRGDVQRAKDVYLALHRQVQGDLRVALVHKVAQCNHQLHLPDADGL